MKDHLCECECCLRWVRGYGTPQDAIMANNHKNLHERKILLDYLMRTGSIPEIKKIIAERLSVLDEDDKAKGKL